MNKSHPFYRPDLEEADCAAADKALKRDLGRILKDGDTVIDVGANRGQFATELLAPFPTLKMHCFEPVSSAFADLSEFASRHHGVSAYDMAVSNKAGEAQMFVTESDVGSSLLEPLEGQPSKWLTKSHTQTVKTIRLDKFIEENKFTSIGLLKSDAQGHDLEVIRSAGSYLRPDFIRSILIELNFRTFYSAQAAPHELMQELFERKFRLAWLYPHRAHDEWLWWADALFLPETNDAK